MANDPYKVLGVDPSATEEEIKKAYRDLVRKYHPDHYANTPLADLAEEKMKEINEAYDTVQKMRKEEEERRSYYQNTGNTEESFRSTSNFSDIRACIAARDFYEAGIRLDSVPMGQRNAEWYYLKGFVFRAKGWYFEASKFFEAACRMEPGNEEYRIAAENIRNYTSSQSRRNASDSVCDVCTTLICMDCMCELCGGDLIACC